ncbi:MAG: tRNA 2-thiouridine synthesizing protein A [Lentisphaeria bacterium]|jgi:tRNA 2-thiouridine synthesizing protein A
MDDGSQYKIDFVVDARGLSCPMPLLKAKLALNSLEVNQYLRMTATDLVSLQDIHSFVELTEHTLLSVDEREGEYTYIIMKGAQADYD